MSVSICQFLNMEDFNQAWTKNNQVICSENTKRKFSNHYTSVTTLHSSDDMRRYDPPSYWLFPLSVTGRRLQQMVSRWREFCREKRSFFTHLKHTGAESVCSLSYNKHYRCVIPLSWQVLWLRWVGHPGRATVWGRWRHDKVVWVTRAVGRYSVDCCYWVSCEMWREI